MMAADWGRKSANLSLQYGPDLASMPSNPQLPSNSTASRPSILDVPMDHSNNIFMPPLALQNLNSLPANATVDRLNRDSLLKQSILEVQQQAIYRAMKRKSFGSPDSPLSPQESVGLSDSSSICPQSHDLYRFKPNDGCAQSQASSIGSSCERRATPFSRNVQLSDLPIICGPAAFQNSTRTEIQVSKSIGTAWLSGIKGDSALNAREGRGNGEFKRLKWTLEELERELFSDDGSSICDNGQAGQSLVTEPAEKDWTDVLEDLLFENSSLHPQTAGLMTSVGQSAINSTTNGGSRPVKGQSSLVSEATTAVHALKISSPTQQVIVSQPSQSNADVIERPKQLLLSCAAAINEDSFELANSLVAKLRSLVSIHGTPMQRLAAYMLEGLVARIESSGHCLYTALKCKDPPATDVLCGMQVLYQICPYYKFGYMAANGAIAEAFKDEGSVHIIDFEIGQGSQWVALIGAFAGRPRGPPKVRITGVDDPLSNPKGAAGLMSVEKRLTDLAKSLGVPFEFHPVAMQISKVQSWMLGTRSEEALAVNFAFQLHHMPDESVCTTNPRDRLLQTVRSLKPKVVTLVEHEANTNTAPFYPRFLETLNYFTAVFESLDTSLPRESPQRVNVEQTCLAKDIVNIIACEGPDRVERYELAGKWRARLTMAGFQPCPLSSYINGTISSLLKNYSSKYRLREEGGALYLGWLDRVLIVASAWQ